MQLTVKGMEAGLQGNGTGHAAQACHTNSNYIMGCLFPNPFRWGVTLATGQQCEAHDGIIEGVFACARASVFVPLPVLVFA